MTDDLILQAREMQKRMIATTLPGELADALEAQAREIDRLRDEYIAYMESQLKKDARIAALEAENKKLRDIDSWNAKYRAARAALEKTPEDWSHKNDGWR